MRWDRQIVLGLALFASPPASANIYGADDRPLPASTTFTVEEAVRFSGIGRIECKADNGETRGATGFMVERKRTLVTAAHVFFNDDGSRRTDCAALYFSPQGTPIDEVPVTFVYTRWDEPAARNDHSNDIGHVLLARDPLFGTPARRIAVNFVIAPGSAVHIVGYSGPRREVRRRLFGRAWQARPGDCVARSLKQKGVTATNLDHLAAADFDSDRGASGAPVFSADGALIGVHFGSCGKPGRPFDPVANYNAFMRLDDRFERDVRAFGLLADMPIAPRKP